MPETDLDQVAEIAADLADRVREEDPMRVFSELQGLCHQHPAKAAQVLMCLAIWFDTDATTTTLVRRAHLASVRRSA